MSKKKEVNCQLPGAELVAAGKSVEGHWAAPFYDILPKSAGTLDDKSLNRFHLVQIDACREMLRMIGVQSVSPHFARNAMEVVLSPEATAVQKTAAAVILDYCSPDWRDSATMETLGTVAERNDPLVLVWREQVLSRDGYKCVKCGSKKEIQAHHIVRWVDMPEARLLPENGMTLCRVCHVNVHGHGAAA